jgi:hypothetical protein
MGILSDLWDKLRFWRNSDDKAIKDFLNKTTVAIKRAQERAEEARRKLNEKGRAD